MTNLSAFNSLNPLQSANLARFASPSPSGSAEFSQNPQDKVVMEAGTYVVTGLLGGDTPQVEKARLNSPLEAVEGKFVFAATEPGFHAANSFSAVARTIKFFEEGTGHSIQWSFGRPQLDVNPDQGEMLNAYYQPSEGNVNFFHSTDPVTKQVIYSGDSGEVVSHETGHAILDSMRPSYMYNWRSDVGAFHESFGDMLALLMSVQDDRTLAKVLEQTGADMTRENVTARLGEELGVTINHTAGRDATGGDFTRNAINKFTWKDPKTLEKNPKDPNQLGSEVHNFSRLWTGAFYDVFTGLVNENRAQGLEPAAAIREASSEGLRMLGRLLEASPKLDFTYRKMAEVFVASDKAAGGKHVDLITSVYKAREILPASFRAEEVPAAQPQRLSFVQQAPKLDLIPLHGDVGNFTGANIEVPFDPQAPRDPLYSQEIRQTVHDAIRNGDILYTDPNQVITTKDLFKSDGQPYVGVLRWRDGQQVIERNRLVT